MVKHFGKMHYEPVTIPGVPFLQTEEQIERGEPEVIMIPPRVVTKLFDANNVAWNDICKGLETGPGIWFIIVDETGWVMGCETDPTMLGLADYDFWQIEHPGGEWDIRRHIWTGEEVVPWDAS